jgi:alcohol dehydrogenase class IV
VDRGFAHAGLLEPILEGAPGARLCALIGEDPDVAECESAATAARKAGAGAVLAIGGGSALCAAKAVAILLTNPGPLGDYEGIGRLESPPALAVAVPTTAGSGSEVSNVVVLHDPGRERHLVIRGRGYEPRVAILDGELLRTLPRAPMIAAALDALSHALESGWARGGTSVTRALAPAAGATLRRALPRVLAGDVDAMQELVEASAIANLACGNSGLGLVHALSSAPSVHLPHGYQNGVLLPHVARFNGAEEELDGLYAQIGFEARFRPGELSAQDVAAMVAAAMSNPFRANNVRESDETDLRTILARAC